MRTPQAAFLGSSLLQLALSTLISAIPLSSHDVASVAPLLAHEDRGPVTGLWWKLLVIAVLLIIDGIVAGLILGLMSLDETDLRILASSGTPAEQHAAAKIAPVRKNGHLLLVTLLTTNAIINESLPILLDPISGGGVQAVVISTIAILIFAEIIPQSVCSRYGLQIGAFFILPVRAMIVCFLPIAWPIAKLLDYLLGADHGMMYKKSQLKDLVGLHGAEHGGDLTADEVTILQGTLNVHLKQVHEVMTPMDRVYMLPATAKLDRTTLQEILKSGHSRIPVYANTRENIIGILLVKTLILLDPNAATPVDQVRLITKVPKAETDTSLFHMLNIFQEGASHLATVYDKDTLIGIITIEDVIEEIIQEEIVDETDVYTSNELVEKPARPPLNNRPTFMHVKRQTPTPTPPPPPSVNQSAHHAAAASKNTRDKKFMGRAAHRSRSQTLDDGAQRYGATTMTRKISLVPSPNPQSASLPSSPTSSSSHPQIQHFPILDSTNMYADPDTDAKTTTNTTMQRPNTNESRVLSMAVQTGNVHGHTPPIDQADEEQEEHEDGEDVGLLDGSTQKLI
ncbi:putative DUF21 and CBS domain protein [Powellomyces hirtus]|nr:putative DUF21 and CBS domain protein [Powellomyces hirtus]